MRTRVVTKRSPTKVERFSIWDNLARHEEELRALGATEVDLAPLREAAKAVDAEESAAAKASGANPALDKGTLTDLLAPYLCANGWVVKPPSLVARRWASSAVLKVTNNQEPTDAIGLCYCVLAGLFVLRAWGEGRHDDVMRLVTAPGELANLLPKLEDSSGNCDFNDLLQDYTVLMGTAKKKGWLRIQFQRTLAALRSRISARSTSSASGNTSAQNAPSASTGKSSAPPLQPGSAPSAGKPTVNRKAS